ncbi:MAG: hypothetical protein KF861_15720, partial [Planctomycetaceae bacterium]|nr:hypothetical protein [Planctomycetaceae bacterium]
PLLFMIPAVVAAAGLAAVLADFRWWRPFVALPVLFATTVVAITRSYWPFDRTSADPAPPWLTPTGGELAGIWVLAVLGAWVALRGIEKARCGEMRSWPDFDVLWHRGAAALSRLWRSPVASRPYGSGVSAQFWHEFWEKGLILPVIAGFIGGVSLIHGFRDSRAWLSGFFDALPTIVGLCLAGGGLIVGLVQVGGKSLVIREYRATRPLSDGALASSVLRAALASAAAALLVVGAEASLVYGWSLIQSPRDVIPQPSAAYLPTALPFAVLIGWSALGLIASVAMTGRAWVMALPWLLLFGAFTAGPLLEGLRLQSDVLHAVQYGLAGILFVAMIVATIAAHVYATRQRLITARTIVAATITWLVTTAFIFFIYRINLGSRDLKGLLLLAGWMSFVAAPLATAPLALSWNRHR